MNTKLLQTLDSLSESLTRFVQAVEENSLHEWSILSYLKKQSKIDFWVDFFSLLFSGPGFITSPVKKLAPLSRLTLGRSACSTLEKHCFKKTSNVDTSPRQEQTSLSLIRNHIGRSDFHIFHSTLLKRVFIVAKVRSSWACAIVVLPRRYSVLHR